jgi:hypothetical protein
MHARLERLAYRRRYGVWVSLGTWQGRSSRQTMGYVGSQGFAYRSSASLIRQTNSGLTVGTHQDSVNQGLRSFG